jgi:hypothetical protein
MAFENQERSRIGRADIKELNCVVAGCSEEALVGGDAESIDLRVRMLNSARADT